ncbi:BON domain-containing protein [Jeongeupia naejangsanensis]|uniref:BON domain-containing protein n=1 Tax=Jeongeupia naejangsanensis TaxID=613195 RepID=A0ABS2BQD9_9NEIS|nr:BON domain-containing protein [Jeongeupia naejangsanensis]MBM3117855.1 BON domain-containing protein [Jeongeupia naejangsanensis]
MNMQTGKRTIVSGIALAILMMNGAGAVGAAAQTAEDARQEAQIWTSYALNPYLRANDLKVSVVEGMATLTGKVDEGVNKDLAKQIALGVPGIKEVDNQIVIQSGYVPPARSSSRSYGEAVDDATITTAVKSKLLWSKYTDSLATSVETKSGRVILTGTADSVAAREHAARLAINTRGVQSVDNRLVVTKTNPVTIGSTASAAGQDISDSWITTKVKSTFLYSNYIDSGNISVSTKNGNVTLVGKLDSGAERSLALELAKNVRGVKSVESKGLTVH